MSFLWFPQYHRVETIKSHVEYLDKLIRSKARFLSVSENTTQDVLNHYGIESSAIRTIYEGVDDQLFHPIYDDKKRVKVLASYGIENEKYFISVNTIEPRKNLNNTLRAFIQFCESTQRNDIKFVLCGQKGWKISRLPKHKNIIVTGYVPDNDLAILYESALALCYISHYEGFDLPPLGHAMQEGRHLWRQ